MALTGQLSDMSLAELIEFFCNQRKTGRLKIDYPRGHSLFFIKEGELVDARVGSLNGPEAVYFSLTLPNAAFDFSPEVEPTRRTVNESWTQVVLEGLRRLDEGLSPTEQDAFGSFSPSDSDMTAMFNQVERLGEQTRKDPAKRGQERAGGEPDEADFAREADTAAPLSIMVDSATAGGGRKKWVVLGVAASLVLACAVVAVPLLSRSPKPPAAPAAPAAAENSAPETGAPAPVPEADAAVEQPATAPTPDAATAEAAARREREERERRERRERERRDEARREAEAAKAAATPMPAPSGPKSVRVAVTYDEAGRVTQASVAGATPGAEGYGSTAVRIARSRRFPAGNPGSTVITIPVN
jgi:hypothetical protein